ncbi:BTAD domain-containing putative transcriptional regulator [Actinoplanes sp. GCM10030250]|uniref:BTAD domain-containing putative transcriptional regulator n=1 Tax=Actinoplanes sp. GCM10030250 TaxID=3273376 RepID=UPI0036145F66
MITFAVILAGFPVVMATINGPPWPDQKPTAAQVQDYLAAPLSPHNAATTGWALAWALWGLVAMGVNSLAVTRLRSRDWRRTWERLCYYLPSPLQSVAAGLLGTAAVATSATALPAHAVTPAAAATPDDCLPTSTPTSHQHHATTLHSQPPSVTRTPTKAPVVTVHQGDTLWEIAERKLDDPTRWRQIFELNRGHEQANGYALRDPDEIHIGWVLAMPAHSGLGSPAPPADTTPSDDGMIEPGPDGAAPTTSAPTAPAAITTAPPTSTPSTVAPSTSINPSTTVAPSASASTTATSEEQPSPAAPDDVPDDETGISLPSQGWVSFGLAALIAAVASLLRLQRRRRARLSFPIPARITAPRAPVPERLAPVDAAGTRHAHTNNDEPHRPSAPVVPAPIGHDADGSEVSLFDLPGPGLALTGDAESAARAVLAAVLATGATQSAEARPMVVTTTEILARLLPTGAALHGLDPDGTSYDGERLIVHSDSAAAVTHAEEEMIVRRRLLDTFDLDSITALNERTDHAETQPPYVLLIEATTRHAARLRAVGAHRAALHLHPVILGELDGIPTAEAAGVVRLSTLVADDLAAVLTMLTDATARAEPGHDIDLDPAPSEPAAAPDEVSIEPAEPVPSKPSEAPAPVRLRVLGPVLVETESGAVATGMRSGSYTVLASLAANPGGRSLDQLAADLHPDTNPGTAGKRIRTDISTTRRVLRAATGNGEAMFVVYDAATGRYRLDPELIAVDLWQMLTAIEVANTAEDDTQALASLREAAELYGGDFAHGADQTWITDYATTYRHQILSVFARIAELLETDHPGQAVTALERALEFDPVNEELYQRVMRIHGRAGRPDAVRRTLRRLEDRLADLGGAEPSEATRRVAERQLRPATASRGHR